MNTTNIVKKIVYKEFESLKGSTREFIYKADEQGLFSDLDFIEHFKDWNETLFWAYFIMLTNIPFETIIEKYKKQVIDNEVYHIILELKQSLSSAPRAWKFVKDVMKNMENYITEYKKYHD